MIKQPLTKSCRSLGLRVVDVQKLSGSTYNKCYCIYYIYMVSQHLTAGHTLLRVVTPQACHTPHGLTDKVEVLHFYRTPLMQSYTMQCRHQGLNGFQVPSIKGSIPLSQSIMYYRPQEIIGFYYLDSIPLVTVLRILSTSLTARSQLSLGNDFSGIYFGCTTRAHTLTQCTQGGDGGRQVSAGPLSSNLLSQVTGPPKQSRRISQCCQKIHKMGEKVDKSSTHGKFWPSHHSPVRPP